MALGTSPTSGCPQVTLADVLTDSTDSTDCNEGLDLRQLRATAKRAATYLGDVGRLVKDPRSVHRVKP